MKFVKRNIPGQIFINFLKINALRPRKRFALKESQVVLYVN